MTLLEMNLTGSAMIVLIIVLRALLMNHLPKRTFVCLWALALIRLMLPFSIPVQMPWTAPEQAPSAMPVAVTQMRTFARRNLPANAWPGMAAPEQSAINQAQVQAWPATPAQIPVESLPAKQVNWLAVVYFTGAALVGLYLLSAYALLRREFKKSRELTDGAAVGFVRAQRLHRQVRVLVSGRIKSPITYGLIRPCVLLPESMADDAARLPYVLTHELTHIRRLDAPMKLVFAVCLCLHWFNPLVWAMYILYNRDVELACDERVVRVLGAAERAGYAQLLLHMQEGRNRLTPLCNSFSRYSLKERIVSISKYKKTSALMTLLALALVVGIATGFATRADQLPADPPATIQEIESFNPGADIGALFEGYTPYGAGLLATDPDGAGRGYYDLIPMNYNPGYGLPGNEQSDRVMDLLRGIALGEPPQDAPDMQPVWRFGLSATLLSNTDETHSRDVELSLFEGTNLALLSVTDNENGMEQRSGIRYGSLTPAQIEACEAIYEAHRPGSRMVEGLPDAGLRVLNALRRRELLPDVLPWDREFPWSVSIYKLPPDSAQDDSETYATARQTYSDVLRLAITRYEESSLPEQVYVGVTADGGMDALSLALEQQGQLLALPWKKIGSIELPGTWNQPEYTPSPTAAPRATNNPAWINPYQQHEEEQADRPDEPDPGVVHLMSMDWQNMSVSEFVDAVRAERAAQGDDWYPVEYGWTYNPANPVEDEQVGFCNNPLLHALLEINGRHGGYFWRPGNPSGRDIGMYNPEPMEGGQPNISLQGFLGFETLDPSAITVGERERIVAAYYDQLYAFFLSMTPEEWLAVDPIEMLNRERDRLTAALSTPALRVRAVNFYFAYDDGAGQSYYTLGTFIDSAEVPPAQIPVAEAGVRLIATDEQLGIRYGERGGLGVVGPLDAWYGNGWRDPATGIRHSYDPDTDRRQVSIDNGASWYDEYHSRQFGGECSIFFFPESGWSFSDSPMEPYGALPITLHEALGLTPGEA